MRVENPNFDYGHVLCVECPLHVKGTHPPQRELLAGLCYKTECPRNMEEYTAACLMAEESAKGGKG